MEGIMEREGTFTDSNAKMMFRSLVAVRVLNQAGAFAFAFLAVLAGPHLVTAALTVFGAAALVSRWAGGVLLDRVAPRTLVVAGLAATGVSLAALALSRTPAQVLVAIAVTGLAFELYEPATSELLARAADGVRRSDAYALLGTSLAAAGAISGLLAAVLLPFGVRRLVVADAVTSLAAAAVAMALLPRTPRPPARRRDRRWRPPPPLLRLTAAATVYALGYLAVLMYTPYVLLQRGAPAWLPGIAMAAAALLAPAVRRPLSRRPRVMLGVAGGCALAMALSRDLPLTAAAYLVWAAAGGALLGHWPATAADRAPVEDRPRWFAFLGLSWGVAQPVVPGVVGLAAIVTGGTATAAPLTAAVTFLAVPVLLTRRSPGRGTRRATWCRTPPG
jgi:MFS family permease